MKEFILIVFALFISILDYAEKMKVPVIEQEWYAVEGNYSSAEELLKAVKTNSLINPSTYVLPTEKTVTLYTIIDAGSTKESKLFIEMENHHPVPHVLIDGQQLNNLRQDVAFTSEITNNDEKEELLLTLVIDSIPSNRAITLEEYLKGSYLSTISNISIAWCEPIKDPFFGGYMIEVHVFNLTPKDIDGKLKAHINDANTFELIAENNNCAFTRGNSEAIIDINFPDAKDKLIKGKYNIEIALVDKERNEEVIDRLVVPIWLN